MVSKVVNWVRIDWLVKCAYLVLTKNGFPTILGLVSFVVWGMKVVNLGYFRILVLYNCMRILIRYQYFGILALVSCVGNFSWYRWIDRNLLLCFGSNLKDRGYKIRFLYVILIWIPNLERKVSILVDMLGWLLLLVLGGNWG